MVPSLLPGDPLQNSREAGGQGSCYHVPRAQWPSVDSIVVGLAAANSVDDIGLYSIHLHREKMAPLLSGIPTQFLLYDTETGSGISGPMPNLSERIVVGLG